MLSSGQYQAEFIELHERLSAAYNDLGVGLNIVQVRILALNQRGEGTADDANLSGG